MKCTDACGIIITHGIIIGQVLPYLSARLWPRIMNLGVTKILQHNPWEIIDYPKLVLIEDDAYSGHLTIVHL